MAATIYDVARAAGVSPSTVSRALSVPGMVNAETRQRVQAVAAELGYQPNRAARGLITGRTGNIGLIVTDLNNPFFPEVVKGAQSRARESDYSVLLADTGEDPIAEIGLIRTLGKQVDGIVLCSSRMSEVDLRSVTGDTVTVLLNRRVSKVPAVTIDNLGGIRHAVEHLRSLGHHRVAYVAGPRTSWSNRERLRGLRAVTAEAGLDLVELGPVAPTFAAGIDAAGLVRGTPATAVFAYNDLIALGLLRGLQSAGVAVPGDISVIGCDDIMFAEMVSPSLTTLAQPKEQLGRAGVELLFQLLQDATPGNAGRRTVTSQLIIRDSTGTAPASH